MKKFITILLVLAVSFSIVKAEGDIPQFKDIDEVPWAKSYVLKSAEIGIVNGYPDSTFRPKRKVTKCESVLIVYNMLKSKNLIDLENQSKLLSKYESVLEKANIPSWKGLREGVAFFLENKVIPEDDLYNFLDNDVHINISRELISNYLGRALNLYLKENVNKIISGYFIDSDKITADYAQYIDLLYRQGIINGDNNKRFNPKDSLTRAEIAKIIVETVNVVEKKNLTDTVQSSNTYTLIINASERKQRKLKLRNEEDGVLKSYLLGDNVRITINGVYASYMDLMSDMTARVVFDDDNKIQKVIAKTAKGKKLTKGGIVSSITVNEETVGIFYRRHFDSEMQFVEAKKTVKLNRNDEQVDFADVKEGDVIEFIYVGDELVRIETKDSEQTLGGVVKKITEADGIKLNIRINGIDKIFSVADNAVITRNGESVELDRIRINDKVKIVCEYDKITSLEANANAIVTTGKLLEIVRAEKDSIVIEPDGKIGDKTTYVVTDDTEIYVDTKSVRLVDLKIGSKVELESDGSRLLKISTLNKLPENESFGKIVEVNQDNREIKVWLQEDELEYIIKVDSDLTIIGYDGGNIAIDKLEKDMKIFVVGTKNGGELTPTRIHILSGNSDS